MMTGAVFDASSSNAFELEFELTSSMATDATDMADAVGAAPFGANGLLASADSSRWANGSAVFAWLDCCCCCSLDVTGCGS